MSSTDPLTPLPIAHVVPRGEKQFSVVIGGHEVGVSKAQCDANFHANILNQVILDAYKQGCIDTRKIALEELRKAGL